MSVSSNVGAYYQKKCEEYEDILLEVVRIVHDNSTYPPADLEDLAVTAEKILRKSDKNKELLKRAKGRI